jgi:hypothetical protein
LRELITKKTQDEAANLLSDVGFDEKGTELAHKFMDFVPHLKHNTANDGVLVMYMRQKLSKRFGPVSKCDNQALTNSLDYIPKIMDEIRKMLSC